MRGTIMYSGLEPDLFDEKLAPIASFLLNEVACLPAMQLFGKGMAFALLGVILSICWLPITAITLICVVPLAMLEHWANMPNG